MRVMVEFDPMTGAVQVTSPASSEREASFQTGATPGAALDAGGYSGRMPEQPPSTEGATVAAMAAQPAVKEMGQDAGAYAGIDREEQATATRPQSRPNGKGRAPASTAGPTIIDEF